jgi:parallel beta-helix repeat protein
MKISPNIGLNIPEGNDIFDHDKFLTKNLEKVDQYLMNATNVTENFNNVNVQLAEIATNINFFPIQIPEVDDTSRFLRAVNSLPLKGGTILFPSGTYTINNVFLSNFSKFIKLKGSGKTSTVITRSTANIIFNINGTGNGTTIHLEDMTVDGASYHQTGLAFSTSEELKMKDVIVKNCGVPGYAAGNRGAYDGVYAYNIQKATIQDSIFDHNERDGFHGLPVVHLTVENCLFTNNGRLGSVNEPDVINPRIANSQYPLTTTYINNYCENNGSGGLHGESDNSISLGWKPLLLQFTNNHILNCGNDNWTIGWGIVFGVYTYGQAIGNVIKDFATIVSASGANDYRHGIDASQIGGRILLEGNILENIGQIGINIGASGKGIPVILKGNSIYKAGASGVYLYDSQYCSIDANIIEDCLHDGIMLNNSGGANVLGNKIRNNSLAGANLYSGIASITSPDLIINGNEINGANHQFGYNLDSTNYFNTLTFLGNRVNIFGTSATSFSGTLMDIQVTPTKIKASGTGLPASGKYFPKGSYINNTDIFTYGSTGSVKAVVGWIKISNATTNTLGTDWISDEMLTGS